MTGNALDRVVAACYRGAALLLVPIILMVGMMLITVLHTLFVEIVSSGLEAGRILTIMVFLVHMISLALFCGLIWFLYQFVKREGWGLFQ